MASPRPTKLTETDLEGELTRLPGWKLVGGKLHREYKFADFIAAFAFMTSAALVAQSMDHHPEWFNVWSTVRIDLATHDAGGVTRLDIDLARAMEKLAERYVQG